jgi:hypothetical protein
VLWVKSDSDIYYDKTSDKAATKWVTSDLGYTLGGPLSILCSYRLSKPFFLIRRCHALLPTKFIYSRRKRTECFVTLHANFQANVIVNVPRSLFWISNNFVPDCYEYLMMCEKQFQILVSVLNLASKSPVPWTMTRLRMCFHYTGAWTIERRSRVIVHGTGDLEAKFKTLTRIWNCFSHIVRYS